ncbi:NEDD8-activating enzyme E1 catalytic subunit [Ananas comosus]|uniref:NEDD8-activating enzyme E1 catalytic subunit n=1 Tax=Ananas comosus TaxID=4615 RepID=A0A199USI7_ANACO|nr:NEDD8-activating enzyme E1 catalytic subunit [Ananas comosus]
MFCRYNGVEGTHIKVTDFVKDNDCLVCGPGTLIELDTSVTLSQFIELLGKHPGLQLSKPSVTHRGNNLYMQSPPILEEMTRPNLALRMFDLLGEVPKDTVHVSGASEKNGKKTSCSRKLRIVFKGVADMTVGMDTTGN